MTDTIPSEAKKYYDEAVRILTEDMAQRRALRGTDIVIENLLDAVGHHDNYFEAWRLLGEIYLGTEESLEGYLALKRALSLQEHDVGVATLLGEASLIMERPELALKYLEVAQEADTVPLGPLKLIALALAKAEKWDDALRAFGDALAEDPPDGDMRRECAEMLANLKYRSEAVSVLADYLDPFRDFIDKQPVLRDSGWIMPVGAVLDRLSPGAAAKAKDTEITARAEDYRVWYVMGNIFLDGEKYEPAVVCYKRALRVHPDYYDALHNMGLALEEQGRQDEALQMYEAAVEADPDSPDAYLSIAELLEDMAEDELDEIALHYLMYYRLDSEGDGFDELEKILMARLTQAPDIAQILLLAQVYLLRDEIDKADTALKLIEAGSSEEAAFKWIKGRTCHEQGRFDEAEVAYRSSLESVLTGTVELTMDEENLEAKIRYDLACLMDESDRKDEALKILQDDPESLNADGFALLAGLISENEPDTAVEFLRSALDVDQEHLDSLIALAERMIVLGKIEDGIILYERARKVDPEDTDIVDILCELYPKIGTPELVPHKLPSLTGDVKGA